ncbi:hypothetical protein N7457_006649 [Penicillium paradoxum]|uniref:uncharacterized protein n=1 Tax=Penicillium paradoxum TaxID=176176 RepID=UPI0025493B94|nr:uncharacterized protein N7457_006649 [Penicillium paradoxum]KAJ5778929.1 hypothetical protein N7457_006649 [Penicillium paradoxum]
MANQRLPPWLRRLFRFLHPRLRHRSTRSSEAEAVVPAPREAANEAPDEVLPICFDIPIHYVFPMLGVLSKGIVSAPFGKRWESFEERFQQFMADTNSPMESDRTNPCRLMWLPIEIRAKIWKYVFDANDDVLILDKSGITPKVKYPMRLVSCFWAEETWAAYINALATRTLVVLDYPEHGYLEMPCPIFADLEEVRIREVKFVLGNKNVSKAEIQIREFITFMLVHRDLGRFTVRTVILEFKENWVTTFFHELHIADLLTCAFYAIEKLQIHGLITATRVGRLLHRIKRAG